jgi:epoxyqueuosine reductase
MKLTTDAVKNRARELGADFVGVASASSLADANEGYRPGDLLPEAKYVISVGVRNLQSYMEKSPDPVFFMYGYRQKNDLINKIVWNTARMIDHAGYYALPIQAYGEGELFVDTSALPRRAERRMKARAQMRGSFSHVKAAARAGLGEVGLSGMLIHPECGPRIHLGSIITTAPLEADEPYEGKLCDGVKCAKCLEWCPAKAIGKEGKLSDVDCLIALDQLTTNYEDTIRQILDKQAKEDPLRRADYAIGYAEFAGIGYCGIPCVNACPVGKRLLK